MEIETSSGPARVVVDEPPRAPAFLLALTHGSGGTPDTADILAVRDAGFARGAVTALVTQPYVVRGARAPGSASKQDAAWAEIMAALAKRYPGLPVIQAGRSNGARVVCRTAGAVGARGVIALAFPLHPPGQREKSRAHELPVGEMPTLVLNGERDPFGIPEGGGGRGGGGGGSPGGGGGRGRRVVVLPGETHALSKNTAAIGAAVTGWLREVLAD